MREFAGSAHNRRSDDALAAFADPSIGASIGGEGSVRVPPHRDLEAIAAKPKIYLGYSDSTSIHFAIRTAAYRPFGARREEAGDL